MREPSGDVGGRLLPGLGSILFAAQLNLLFARAQVFLDDPGTGWHLRAGRWMLEERRWIRTDPFSFTHAGEPWITFEWLSQVIFASVEHAAGLGGLVWFGVSLLACVPLLLFRWVTTNGISIGVAFAFTVAALLVLQEHALARPHLFTYVAMTILFLTVGPRMAEGPSSRQGLALAALFVAWANLHGGFVAGLLWLGARAAGFSLDRAGEPVPGRTLHGWWIVLAVSAAVTVVNPHGWWLHHKVWETVFALETVRYWEEFMPPDFYGPSLLASVVLAIVFLLLIGMRTTALARLRWEELVPLLVFLFFAFKSQRHVFLLLLVAAVPVCRMIDGLWPRLPGAAPARWQRFGEIARRSGGDVWAIPLLALVFGGIFLASDAPGALRVGSTRLSVAGAEFLERNVGSVQRPLTTTENGGPLLYYFFPRLRVSFDDRSDFYGDRENLRYLRLFEMRPGWRETLRENRFDSAILSPHAPLAQGLPLLPGWREVHRDDVIAIFLRSQEGNTSGSISRPDADAPRRARARDDVRDDRSTRRTGR